MELDNKRDLRTFLVEHHNTAFYSFYTEKLKILSVLPERKLFSKHLTFELCNNDWVNDIKSSIKSKSMPLQLVSLSSNMLLIIYLH